ncbi:hypothetical protein [Ruegeria sp. Ofav3-42]|uniref:hypothetical protein n=1 Tax=Ruegeria sp. Ofav3-42 TaxID=2917759 RepID=UPI001EF716C4|nr:hypothetical protein [Ruegeria sp. Ofav3-42]MCG7519835.1 hypothetical protein [Ruegeria sp. Ofav3-42]
MQPATKTDWTSPAALDAARRQTRAFLQALPTFDALSQAERQKIAGDTATVLSYMTDPDGVFSELDEKQGQPTPRTSETPQAGALSDAVDATRQALSESPGFAGQDFVAGAVEQGVEQYGELIQKVDFPKFVGGLITNVFQAMVEASIEQMRAYGELIANVAKTVDQFMVDNISQGAGRDYLVDKYAGDLGIGITSGADSFFEGDGAAQTQARLETRGEEPEVALARISKEMNINPPIMDISDSDAELRLVTAARLEMAKTRQQLLSSMVMLGINRIVVTDGSIRAKVIFDMRAEDTANRRYTASMHDQKTDRSSMHARAGYGAWYSPVSGSIGAESSSEHVATVGSAVDETSESKAEVKSRLSGEVRVNFKSDYLPLEKMATPGMISTIQGNSTPFNPNSGPADGGR